jgi:hypothetical protein
MYSFRTNNSVAIYDGSIDCHLVFENRKFLLFKLSVLQSRTGTSVAQSSERCPLWISSIRFSLGTSDRYAKKVSQDLESRIGFLLVFCSHPRTGHRITFIEAFLWSDMTIPLFVSPHRNENCRVVVEWEGNTPPPPLVLLHVKYSRQFVYNVNLEKAKNRQICQKCRMYCPAVICFTCFARFKWDSFRLYWYTGASLDLFEWGGGGVSEFCRVIKANFADSLNPLINISFPKNVGDVNYRGLVPTFYMRYKK